MKIFQSAFQAKYEHCYIGVLLFLFPNNTVCPTHGQYLSQNRKIHTDCVLTSRNVPKYKDQLYFY